MIMIGTDPFICKICGRQSFETQLICDSEDFCICKDGYGCKKEIVHHNIFKKIYKELCINGKECFPRGLRTKEIENFYCIFPPYVRFPNFEKRNLKLDYIKREFLWYLKGNKFDTSIQQHAKMWTNFINDDGSINSNYGQYIFGKLNQFDNIIKTLINDKDSRRATIVILQPYHLLNTWKEIPCTETISFKIRDNKLNMTVKMRSQDAFLGFGSDIPIFSFIHEMVFNVLKDTYKDLEYGNYSHFVESFHVYEKHFDLIYEFSTKDKFYLIDCPKIFSANEVKFILTQNFSNIPNEFKFSKWLCDI